MHNPLEMDTYRVGPETYRRNYPLEKASTAAPAAGATFRATTAESDDAVAEDDERTLSPSSSSGRCASSEVRPAHFSDSDYESPGKRACISTDQRTATAAIIAETAQEFGEGSSGGENGPIIVQRKTVEVVSAEDGWVYTDKATEDKTLDGTVRYDEAEQYFYDSLLVPTILVGMLRGKGGNKQKEIEQQNRCKILFPPKPKQQAAGTETEIKVTSTESALHVQSCGEALKKALANARRSASPTHFISVPIFDPNFRKQYAELLDQIHKDETLPGELRNTKMFMTPEKLHLTINVLKLFTDEEVERVRKFLDEQFQSDKIREILKGTDGQLRVKFETLRPMVRQSKEHCRILFAQPEPEELNTLQRLVNALDDALAEDGLVRRREGEDVLLHMTVMNTKYLRGLFPPLYPQTVDVTQLLERYGQLHFDPIQVEQLHLCEMRSNPNAGALNGYVSVHSIEFATATN